jgi:3-hydroxybutyryl-CoA dehydrogenase
MNLLLINPQPVTTLFGKTFPLEGVHCTTVAAVPDTGFGNTDCIIDLSFEEHPDRLSTYIAGNVPVLLGSVVDTLEDLGIPVSTPIARFNHWPYFINRNCIEFAAHPEQRVVFEQLFTKLELPFFATADCVGFVSARTISMIINEAYFAMEENVSTEAEIDTAMKLGTSYPMGPFEWCKAIGNHRILTLLQKLAVTDARYQPAISLIQSTTT